VLEMPIKILLARGVEPIFVIYFLISVSLIIAMVDDWKKLL
jgi:hypothetical protein